VIAQLPYVAALRDRFFCGIIDRLRVKIVLCGSVQRDIERPLAVIVEVYESAPLMRVLPCAGDMAPR